MTYWGKNGWINQMQEHQDDWGYIETPLWFWSY